MDCLDFQWEILWCSNRTAQVVLSSKDLEQSRLNFRLNIVSQTIDFEKCFVSAYIRWQTPVNDANLASRTLLSNSGKRWGSIFWDTRDASSAMLSFCHCSPLEDPNRSVRACRSHLCGCLRERSVSDCDTIRYRAQCIKFRHSKPFKISCLKNFASCQQAHRAPDA